MNAIELIHIGDEYHQFQMNDGYRLENILVCVVGFDIQWRT